ncbi:MAG: iron ABC transporter permease, partial [Lachnospiraceae bacterium]|nr:iron ABC transporter permease [Lachnospiraceae bacterium]
PALFMLGAVITMLCDLIARTATLPTELPLSTVTAIFGAPTVLVMMAGRRRGNEH